MNKIMGLFFLIFASSLIAMELSQYENENIHDLAKRIAFQQAVIYLERAPKDDHLFGRFLNKRNEINSYAYASKAFPETIQYAKLFSCLALVNKKTYIRLEELALFYRTVFFDFLQIRAVEILKLAKKVSGASCFDKELMYIGYENCLLTYEAESSWMRYFWSVQKCRETFVPNLLREGFYIASSRGKRTEGLLNISLPFLLKDLERKPLLKKQKENGFIQCIDEHWYKLSLYKEDYYAFLDADINDNGDVLWSSPEKPKRFYTRAAQSLLGSELWDRGFEVYYIDEYAKNNPQLASQLSDAQKSIIEIKKVVCKENNFTKCIVQ